jgi:hypothetical protein
LRYKGHVTSKYPVWASALALLLSVSSCSPAASPSPTPAPTARGAASASASAPSPTASGLAAAPVARFGPVRRWYTVPDGATREDVAVAVTFPNADAEAGSPRLRLRANGRITALERSDLGATLWRGTMPLDGVVPGEQELEAIVRLRDGRDVPVASTRFLVSAPEYVVWTLDFEGDAASDATMANTAAIADALKLPMTVMWNPRAWTTTAVAAPQAEVMLAWTKGRAAKGNEVALHLHMYLDYVRAAGVTPKSRPAWSGRSDGYDVPMTAYSEDEQRSLIAYGLRLMADHGLTGITSFRAGGLFADAATLRAAAASGMTADCSATGAGTFGSLRLPWTLAADAQPYRPSRDDANKPGDLALLEAPTNGGNTYGYTAASIAAVVRADLAMLAKPGAVAAERRAITIVSHPGTIDATERAAIEALFRAFDPLRYDQDAGPLRFVTLRQLAAAWR